MNKIKIGQIGIGHNHGSEKMRAVRKYPDLFDVVGWCEEDENWINARSSFDVYKDLPRMSREELLDKCEAMLIETDVWRMMTAASECVERGIHIHLDKPAGENLAEYTDILSTAEKKRAVVQLGYMYRYNPAFLYILEKVRSGELGEVLMVHAEMNTEHDAAFRKWLEHFRGGDMYIFGSHLIDLVLLLQGEPQQLSAFLKKTRLDDTDSYDSALAVLEYSRGCSTVRVTSNEPNGYGRRQLVVNCEGGAFEIKPFENPCRMVFTPKGKFNPYSYHADEIALPELSGRYDAMIEDLYKFIRKGKENPFSYGYELMLHSWILKACNII